MPEHFSIYGIMNGVIYDEGICYMKNGRYYLEWVGLGTKRQISKKMYIELYESDLRIVE